MKNICFQNSLKQFLLVVVLLFFTNVFSQGTTVKSNNHFWKNVQFGGGLGLGFGSGYTDITIAPSAIYNFNKYVAVGTGLQYSYFRQRDFFKSSNYGGSIIGIFNPIPEVQLSVELEQLRVNLTYENVNMTDDFWNTALFVGAGYRSGNFTVGARYNLLFDKDKNVYGDALMPFVRMYF